MILKQTTCKSCSSPAMAGLHHCSACLLTPVVLTKSGSSTSHQSLTFHPGSRIGRFEILENLGAGGFSEVYSVEDNKSPNRASIALKVMRMGLNSAEFLSRFEQEHVMLRRLEDPGIVKVYESGCTPDGRPYFAMEQIDGLCITDYCNTERLSLELRVDLFINVCRAVHHAHQKGVIHRDLKPANILVAHRDGISVPYVIDFGLAKAVESWNKPSTSEPSNAWVTQFGVTMGTPGYISPEQAEGTEDADTLSDVFSLGVVLYELVAQCPPWPHEAWKQIPHSKWSSYKRENVPVKPSLHHPHYAHGRHIDDDLNTICGKALSIDREQRYESVSQLATDLKYWLRGDPVLAKPPSISYRLRKLVARYRWQSATVIALLGTCVLAAIFGVTLALRERSYANHYQTLNTRAEKSASIAREQRDSALGILNDLAFKHQQEFDVDDAFLVEIQLSSLEITVRGLEKIEAINGASDEGSLTMAVVLRRLGETYYLMDRFDEGAQSLGKSEQLLLELVDRQPNNQKIMMALADVAIALNDNIRNQKDNRLMLDRFALTIQRCRESKLDESLKGAQKFADLLISQAQCQMNDKLITEALESLQEAEKTIQSQTGDDDTKKHTLFIAALEIQMYQAFAYRLKGDLASARQIAGRTIEQIEELGQLVEKDFSVVEIQLGCFQVLGCLSSKAEQIAEPRWREYYASLKKRLRIFAATNESWLEAEANTILELATDRLHEGASDATMEFLLLRIELSEARLASLPKDSAALFFMLDSQVSAADVEMGRRSRRSKIRAMDYCFQAFTCFEEINSVSGTKRAEWTILADAVGFLFELCNALKDENPQQKLAEEWTRKIFLWTDDEKLTQAAVKKDLDRIRKKCDRILSITADRL